MGEYAIRNSDRAEIKIGTCEDMYYLRFEDRHEITGKRGNVNPSRDAECDGLRFRLPFPDEDHLRPGDYCDYNRGERLYKYEPCSFCKGGTVDYYKDGCPHCQGTRKEPYCTDFADPDTLESPGTFQMYHKQSGLIFSVPCYHGMKLPDLGPNVKPGWNGKGYAFELSSLRCVEEEPNRLKLYPVIRCRFCEQAWRYQWADVIDFIPEDLRQRLAVYAVLEPIAV